ncbi:MAG: UDP-N-acetylglucosamine--N-acetylmuramyl-(pentapeptide) pyrophosphoryl-undecaprenol N-acetylglucosamine transferase [Aminivibrio sp.]|jgi:UDP-N-acetylglucosamine--N-acetylmuramyl-(pentapeptide) pyrophosphoryl-undecaprenol N-acetylglucosamine transferase|nr:UDP-N-acetylglucosamine--N-acetylmuramyl-(pentapeptide) pyrophosphoryl-undecaprenol N-acetylglucosamine transferase [Synergistaceae bacterium]
MTRVCLVAGGTGGHIFPALAFGEWLEERVENVSVGFVCGSRPLESEIYGSRGVSPFKLPVSGSPFGAPGFAVRARRWRETIASFFIFLKYLRKEEWDCCVLFGGYVSFPALLACRLKKVPFVIHEQNAAAGKVTRIAVRLGGKAASGWDECAPLPEGSFTPAGVPVRKFSPLGKREGWESLGSGRKFPENTIIGVLGGSLMSEGLVQLLYSIFRDEAFKTFTFLLLGSSEKVHSGKVPENVIFIKKQWDMNSFYSVIDGAITRGGASTLSELMLWKIPAVVIPWKLAADNHQERNARRFVDLASGEIWSEGEPPELLKEKLLSILTNAPTARIELSAGDESERLWRLISSSIGRETANFG